MIRGEWYGVVEDTRDPLKLGRVRVRIKGIHTDNKMKLPTEDLPWASVQQPPNVWGTFSVLLEGTNVTGYFSDGVKSQMPVVTGTIPQIFSQIGDVTNMAGWIKRDRPNGIPVYGTINSTSVGYAAQGNVANTNIAVTNRTLDHACDFRYFINLPSITIGLNNPITEIQDAIRRGKNKSAQLMSLMLTQMNTYLRQIINGLLPALGLDPSGIASKSYSVAKDIVRQINALTKKVAMIAETASLYYNLVKDIQQIVDYLRSLPDRIMAMIQGCIDQFLGSLKNFIDMLKSIPGMFSSDMENMLAQLSGATQTALETTTNTANTANNISGNTNVSELISITLYETDADHANIIMDFINTNFGNATVTLANATANSFSKSSMQSP